MQTKTTRGFTLIELLVVIAIIGILSSVVLASLNTARLKSRDTRRISDIKQLQLALALYYDSNASTYPSLLSALQPTYIPVVPTDPVGGAAYRYAAGSTATCGNNAGTSYHLGATLEETTNSAFSTDSDAAVMTNVCTNSAADFVGTDPIYDVKP